jgi:glycosyltransferase involved in cell wall biosynthesis
MNWIVSELFYPDELSTAKIMTQIALKKLFNTEVRVICGPSGYEKSYEIDRDIITSKIKIYSINLPTLNKNNLFQRTLRLLFLTLKMSWVIFLKVKKNDKVLITTNPTFLILALWCLKKMLGFNLEILVHDIFPENLVPAGLINKSSLRYILLKKIYNAAYENADRIIVLGEDMKCLMAEKLKNFSSPIDIIPNWADDDIRPIPHFLPSDYLGIELRDKIIIGFAGNLGRVQGIIEFIELFKSSTNPKLILIIIGDGAMRNAIINKIEVEGINNVIYLGPRPRSEQNLFLNSCHIGLITLISGMKGLGVPSKTYNLMAAGKPLFFIGDKFSEVDRYINKYDCGWSFDWDSTKEIKDFFDSFSIDFLDKIHFKSKNSLNASENFKKEKILELF